MTVPSKSPALTAVITLGSPYAVRPLVVEPLASWLVAPLKNTANTFVPATRTGSPDPSWRRVSTHWSWTSWGSPLVKPNVTRSTFPTCWACTEVSVGSTTRSGVAAVAGDRKGRPSPMMATTGASRRDLSVMTTSRVLVLI